MTLLSDMKAELHKAVFYNQFDPGEAEYLTQSKLIEDEVWDDNHRWFSFYRAVFGRSEQFVAVIYARPKTELQELDDPYLDIYSVYPQEVTRTIYTKMKV